MLRSRLHGAHEVEGDDDLQKALGRRRLPLAQLQTSLGSPSRALPADLTTQPACAAPSRLMSQKLAYNFIPSAERYSAGTAERSTSGRCCASASGMCAATQGYRTVKSEKSLASRERNLSAAISLSAAAETALPKFGQKRAQRTGR